MPLSLADFTFFDIDNFLQVIQDTAWTQFNKEYDTLLLQNLAQELQESAKSSLSPILFFLEWFSPKYRILFELEKGGDIKVLETLITRLTPTQKAKIYTTVL